MPNLRMNLEVHGRVQGVFFRQSTVEAARNLCVNGWVRNTSAGTVEVCAEGLEEQVRALARWCHSGPPSARVDRVDQHEAEFTGAFERFSIVR